MNKKPEASFYRHLIRDAWKTVRDNRLLWIFGFFVAFLGNGGVYELLVQGTGRLGLQEDFGGLGALLGLIPSGTEIARGLEKISAFSAAVFFLVFVACVALGAVALWVVISSQGALIAGIRDESKGKRLKFAAMFNVGGEVFWPLLALNILSRAAITSFFYLLLSILVLFMTKATLANGLLYLAAFLVIVPLTLVIGFVTIYAACYLTLHRLRFVEAVETGIALFRGYWLISLETALILFAVNVIVALLLAFVMAILVALYLLMFGLIVASAGVGPWILLVIGATMAVTLLVTAGAGLAAFQYAVWTLLFIKLNQRGHGAVAKIVRLYNRLLGR